MTELQTGGRQADAAATYKIASIPADGVGKEVVAAGRKVLDFVAEQSNGTFAFEWDEFDWGSEYYARTGRMMAEDGLETLKNYDAIYFGAVGWANVPDHISLWGLRLNITQNFDQWANVRPVQVPPRRPVPAAQGRRHRTRLGRRPGEQRRRVRRPRRPEPVRPRPGQRGRPADRAVHREGLRADHALRVRPGPHPHREEGLQRHQVQRPAVRHGAVGRDLQAGRARTTRTWPPRACWSTR